ncbi:hypothetical protein WBP07_20750 (plasmid) [Novosphingobium sp. BL-8A]|uniref:hypothetical protein n=1 Tax=Novosphingobium sp. BL-8A TaxID=3127639 RepID=UPI003756D42E
MAENFLSYLMRESERLELAIVVADTNQATLPEIHRMQFIYRALHDQIALWLRDLADDDGGSLQAAA